MLTKVDIGSSS